MNQSKGMYRGTRNGIDRGTIKVVQGTGGGDRGEESKKAKKRKV